jgi:O-antigen ligase
LNWQAVRQITHVEIGRFLALMLIAWSPFTGGPRLPSLLLAGMGLWLLVTRRGELAGQRALRRWWWVFGLLWLPVALSVPGSLDWQRSASIAGALLVYFLAGVALVHVLRADQDRRWLVKWTAIVLLLWVVDGLIQFGFGRDLLWIPLSPDGRVVGFFEDNLRLALFLAVLLPLLLQQAYKTHVLWLLAVFVATSGVIVLGGSRSALLMIIIAVFGMSLRLSARHKIILSAILLLTLAGTISLSPVMLERVTRFDASHGVSFESVDTLLSGRLTIWETAMNMLKDRPLSGVGAGTFADAYDQYATRADDIFRTGGKYPGGVYHAHQMYISVAAETGLAGFAGIGAIYLLCMIWYFRASRERRDPALPFAFSLFVATFPINSQPVLFTHWWFPLILLLMCGMLAALGDDQPGGDKTPGSG